MSCRKNSQEEFLTALALAPKGWPPRKEAIKIPLTERTTTAKRAGRAGRGVLSFGYLSLHKQRKVTRSQSESFGL